MENCAFACCFLKSANIFGLNLKRFTPLAHLNSFLISTNPHNIVVRPKRNTIIPEQPTGRISADVLILGGGLAGLGAALFLQEESSLQYFILEADNRAGGRVHTVPMNTHQNLKSTACLETICVDAGAQWLHGKSNRLHDVAEKHNLLRSELSEEGLGVFLRRGGYIVDEFLVKRMDFEIGKILEECEKFAVENSLKYPESVEAFLSDRFSKFMEMPDSQPFERELAWCLLDWHIRFQIIDNSCLDLDKVSARFWGRYSFNGESCQAHINFRNGFGEAVDKIMQQLNRKTILFEHVVESIEALSSGGVCVRCRNGSVFEARHIICTFSLGVLKSTATTLFQPKLPLIIRNTIAAMGFDAINKIFLQFDSAWWGDWEGIQLLFPHVKRSCNESVHWTEYVTGFDILYPGPPNILVGWIGGQGAIEMEQLTNEEIAMELVKLLRDFTRLPVDQPKQFYFTRWYSNPYIKGAYSYLSTNCDRAGITNATLSEMMHFDGTDWKVIGDIRSKLNGDNHKQSSGELELTKSALLFAGEACHSKYFSTAHGAFQSGIEQAEKLLAFHESV